AVAIGMVAAGRIAVEMGLWEEDATQRQFELIQKAGLPTQLPTELDIEAILEALTADKKVKAGKVRFVLPTRIGQATVTDQVASEVIRRVLGGMQLS
ncbi:MAG: 3-dehydroquinate synthase, partial [Pseudanabaenales cyanobacterium]|nr:3-dehydroquinate synthase [Pseudanabaenales cyanobacterium]